ncbi:MAG: hypothetical protein LBM62_09545 [Mediterranea sp.]|jgi:tyrosine-protein phosphatase YwqE|nr:hypothetical protein [Mediterranea sp.]
MFLFKREIHPAETDILKGFTDWHCHIVPGVDDGMRDLEDALETLEYYQSLQVNEVIFTPHVMNGMPVNWETIVQAYEHLKQQYRGNIQLRLGGEYMLDSGFKKRVEGGLQPLKDKRVLVETSYLAPPDCLFEMLYEVSISGYIPVIAHPERYLYMKPRDYSRLKNNEYLFQLNLLSLSDYYNKQVKERAEYLLDAGMYNLTGSDLHSREKFRYHWEHMKISRRLFKKLEILVEKSNGRPTGKNSPT